MSGAIPDPAKTISEAMAKLQKEADDLCARDTLAARTRMLLLKLEKQAHRLGWDHPDNIGMVFQSQYNPRTHHVDHRWSDNFTDIIKIISDRNGGNIGQAFQELAAVSEGMLKGEMDYRLPPQYRNINWARPGKDLWEGDRPGWKFYGYGFRYEAWIVEADHEEHTELLRRAHSLDSHPNRVEARQVCLAARDGRLWCVSRVRGQQATVYIEPSDAVGSGMAGNVVNGLGRLTNTIAGEPVPIRPRAPAGTQL
jgi:hypothetical protein